MPLMIPPENARLYNGRNVAAGEAVEVLERDVEALTAAGWRPPNLKGDPITQEEPADLAAAEKAAPKAKNKTSNRKPSKGA